MRILCGRILQPVEAGHRLTGAVRERRNFVLGNHEPGNYIAGMPEPERNFGFLVHDVARLLRTVYDRRTRALGLTRSQWWVLNHLYLDDGISQTELADVLDVEKPSLGRLLDRLEAKDWVERRSDPNDRRVKRVHLTPRVAPLVRELRAIAADLRGEALEGLDERDREQFLATLLLIKGNLLRMSANGSATALLPETVDG